MPSKLRILFLEDSLYDAELSIAALEGAGYKCQWERVETRAEFLARLASPAPDYDVILADYNLPTFDGLTALKLFLERDLDIPFILVSGALGEEIAIESLKTGATDYVLKDRLSRLAPVVKRALHEKEEQRRRKQAETKIRRQNRELALLNRIISASAANPEPETILETACYELALTFEIPQAAAALLNEEKTAAAVAAEYLVEGRPSALNEIIPVAGNPSLQYLFTHKAPLVVADAQNDPQLAPIHKLMRQRGTVSLLLVPLIIEDEAIGSLGLDSLEARNFSSAEISLAWNVADQAGGALARTRLAQIQRRLIAAIEQAGESVVITDIKGSILYVNPAFEKVGGYHRAEAIGQNPRVLKSGRQDNAFYKELWDTIAAGKVWRGRFINKKKDGSLYTEDAVVAPVRNKHGEIVNYIATKRDITQELQLEEQYRQAQKMEAVGPGASPTTSIIC